MRRYAIITVLLVGILQNFGSQAAETNSLGLSQMQNVFKQHISKNPADNLLMPKIYVFDREKRLFLEANEWVEIFNLSSPDIAKSLHSLSSTGELSKSVGDLEATVELNEHQRSSSKYIVFYADMPISALGPVIEAHPSFPNDIANIIDIVSARDDTIVYTSF